MSGLNGMLVNGSHGAAEQFRVRANYMEVILAAAGQILPAVCWYGLTGKFTVVLNFSRSTLTHVRTFASRKGEADKYSPDRYQLALEKIDRACAAAIACLPKANYTGSVTIEFTHTNGMVSLEDTVFGNVFEIRG